MANARFKRGSGAYKCEAPGCGRTTRDTGNGEAEVRNCYHCFMIGSIENQIADGSYYGDQTEESCRAEIAKLTEQRDALKK